MRLLQGNCLDVLKTLPDESVQCVVTSPPYWGLRNYEVEGQLGLEASPDLYVENLVFIFREIWRVLRKDGTVWLNLGDSYYGSGKGYKDKTVSKQNTNIGSLAFRNKKPATLNKHEFLKPKDLVGIPWRVAFALQRYGWYLRQDIIWNKPNPMPFPAEDRCVTSHEYIFLLTKSKKYYFDYEAIKEPAVWDVDGEGTIKRKERVKNGQKSNPSKNKNGIRKQDKMGRTYEGFNDRYKKGVRIVYPAGKHGDTHGSPKTVTGMRNKRSVWTITTKGYPEAHFAVYPSDLIEPCILAGCPRGGVVLDPFNGSGTTGLVALQNGRDYIGIELNSEYIKLTEKRLKEIEVNMI